MVWIILILTSMVGFSQTQAPVIHTVPDNWGGREVMNGYRLKDFGNFDETWKMITVRYRHDTKEQRFTYANPKAYKAIMSGVTEYPDGAIFAKIGFLTEADPKFVSSAVPSGAKRYQFMVRDKKKYKDTDGWGYVLFQGDGKTFPENPSEKIQACAACHRVVADRGYVFSVPIFTTPKTFKSQLEVKTKVEKGNTPTQIVFEDIERSRLPKALREALKSSVSQVRKIKGELETSFFQGTLNEIRPTLIAEAKRTNRVATLITKDAHRFTAVEPVENLKCGGSESKGLRFVYTQPVPVQGGKLEFRLMSEEGCH